jgi:ankyrin repeat protein
MDMLEEKVQKAPLTMATKAPLAKNEYEDALTPVAEKPSVKELDDTFVMVSEEEIEGQMKIEAANSQSTAKTDTKVKEDDTSETINEVPTEIFKLVMDLQKSFEGSPLWSPIHEAAKMDNKDVASVLIDQGSNLDLKGKNGLTPIAVAAHYNSLEVARILLENGAASEIPANNMFTALHIAFKKNQLELAQ